VDPGEATSSRLETRKHVIKWNFELDERDGDNTVYIIEDFESIGISAATVLSALVTTVSRLKGSVRDLHTISINTSLDKVDILMCTAAIGKYLNKVAVLKMHHRGEGSMCKTFIARMMFELDESKEQLLLELGSASVRNLGDPWHVYAVLWVEVEYPIDYDGDAASIARVAIKELAARIFDVIRARLG